MSHSRSVNNNTFGDNATIHQGDVNNVFNYPQERRETPPRPFSLIPFRRDPDFVSRGDILDQISARCLKPAGRVALFGLGGVGKSQLAIEFAHRFAEEHSDVWVFWIHAAAQARVEEGFRLIADAVKLPERKQPKADIPLLVRDWLSIEHHGRWLIILDSADDIEVLYNADEADHGKRSLTAYIPQSRNGAIVLTTRNRRLASKLTGSHKNIIEVGPMAETDALALLKKKMGSPLSPVDIRLAEDLVKALDYIPLAISQAAAYIQARKPRSSIEKYLVKFRKSERESMKLLKYEANDIGRDEEASNAVLRTWIISFDYIRSRQPSAADLLSLMSFFDRQGIPEWVLENSTRQSNRLHRSDDSNSKSKTGDKSHSDINSSFEEDILTLRNYCLVSVNEKGDQFEMHRLVQLSIKGWLKSSELQEKFMQRYITLMAKTFPGGKEYEDWAVCQDLFTHVQVALDYRPNDDALGNWTNLLYRGAVYARSQGRYDIAEQMVVESKKAREEKFGRDDVTTLRNTSLLASIISDKGLWKEAEKLQVRVMETRKTKLGAHNIETLKSMSRVASIYQSQGRWKEAEKLQVKVMETRKTTLGLDHPDTLRGMNNLALTYVGQHRWEEAEKLQVKVMETWKTTFGTDHPDTLRGMNNLALTCVGQDRWEEAEKLQVEVMETWKTTLGTDHPSTLSSMYNLAFIWKHQGRHEDALALMKDCLQANQRVLGLQHPETLKSSKWLEAWSNDSE